MKQERLLPQVFHEVRVLRSVDSADEPVADGLSSEDDEWSNAGAVLRGRQYGSCGVKVPSEG